MTQQARSDSPDEDDDEVVVLAAMPNPTSSAPAPFVERSGAVTDRTRVLAAEVPVSLAYNGLAYAVMMASPVDIEDFVTGFTLTEQIVERVDEIEAIDVRPVSLGVLAQVSIRAERGRDMLVRRRNVVGQTGCGICGIVELEQAVRRYPAVTHTPRLDPTAIFAACDALAARQTLNLATGAVHAAAFAAQDGAIVHLREDVGRHNALDKLIGALAREGRDAADGALVMTSRISFELVQKALACRASLLVGISAPTALAVSLAGEHGLTLVALARRDGFQVFADPHGVFRA